MKEIKQAMQAKLEQAGIGFEKIQVFGVIRCNVHVTCISRDTAAKWVNFLGEVFRGEKVACVPHTWDAAQNKGTSMRPTRRSGFLVAVAG